MQQSVIDYIAAIAPEHRELFQRVHRLILEACPEAEVVLSYKMPTYRIGKRRLNVAAWSHGVSIYGWKANGDGGLTRRHPELLTSRGTIQLRTGQADEIADKEIRDLARTALAPRVSLISVVSLKNTLRAQRCIHPRCRNIANPATKWALLLCKSSALTEKSTGAPGSGRPEVTGSS